MRIPFVFLAATLAALALATAGQALAGPISAESRPSPADAGTGT